MGGGGTGGSGTSPPEQPHHGAIGKYKYNLFIRVNIGKYQSFQERNTEVKSLIHQI